MAIKFQPVEDVITADLKAHPLADLFPMMEGEAFTDFLSDIELHGQREPIILFEDKILDGRNRYKACQALAIDPRFKEYQGGDPLGFVISLNLKRRHLTESQRAQVAARLANLPKGANQHTEISASSLTQKDAAKLLNVSVDSVQFAKRVEKDGVPELRKAVETGNIAVSLAAQIAKQPVEVQQYVISPSQEKELSTAVKRLQNAKAMKDEADRFVPPAPLTDDEKAERERIFGTREIRSVLHDVLKAGETVAGFPSPECVAGTVPAAMESIITDNINAMREVSKWFDAFAKAWQAKE